MEGDNSRDAVLSLSSCTKSTETAGLEFIAYQNLSDILKTMKIPRSYYLGKIK